MSTRGELTPLGESCVIITASTSSSPSSHATEDEPMALASSEGWLLLLRWIHFLAGITRARSQKAAPERGTGSGRWLAAPMKKSMGMERTTLVREARPARAPAGAAAGLAGLPDAVSTAFWMTICCFGQITNHTLAHMIVPRRPPV